MARRTAAARQSALIGRTAGGLELGAIAIENNTHAYRVCNPTQVCGVRRKLPGKYPGDCSLPDTGRFADCLLTDAALLRYFGESGGDVARVVNSFHSYQI